MDTVNPNRSFLLIMVGGFSFLAFRSLFTVLQDFFDAFFLNDGIENEPLYMASYSVVSIVIVFVFYLLIKTNYENNLSLLCIILICLYFAFVGLKLYSAKFFAESILGLDAE